MDAKEFFTNAKAQGLSKEQAISIWESMPEMDGKEPSKASEFVSRNVDNVKRVAGNIGRSADAFLRGAASPVTDLTGYLFPNDPNAKFASQEAAKARDGSPTMFNLGEMAGDVGVSIIPAAKGAQLASKIPKAASLVGNIARAAAIGAGAGAGSAATHAAMDVAKGKDIDPGSAIGEVTLSALLGGGGYLAGAGMEKAAPGLLEMLAPGTAALKESKNPPTREGYEMALEKGIIPVWGGFKKAVENVGKFMDRQTALREGFLDASGKRMYVKQIIQNAKDDIEKSIAIGTQGVTPADKQAALKWLDDAAEMARQRPSYNPKNGTISASDAVKFKTSIMKNAKPVMGESQEGRRLASEASGRASNKGLEDLFKGTGAGETLERIQAPMRQMAPIGEALEGRASKTMSPWELRADIASGAGAIPAAMYNPWLALPLLAPAALSLAKHTPGSAALMYQGGKSLLNPSFARDVAAQGGRTLLFGGD